MRNVLFVCKSNTGRSQMGATFLREFRPDLHVYDAGSQVGEREGTLIHEYVIESMKELGFDMSKKVRKQLTSQMVEKADKIIVMDDLNNIPDYLSKSNKVTFWDVQDAAGTDLDFHKKVRDEILKRVQETF